MIHSVQFIANFPRKKLFQVNQPDKRSNKVTYKRLNHPQNYSGSHDNCLSDVHNVSAAVLDAVKLHKLTAWWTVDFQRHAVYNSANGSWIYA